MITRTHGYSPHPTDSIDETPDFLMYVIRIIRIKKSACWNRYCFIDACYLSATGCYLSAVAG